MMDKHHCKEISCYKDACEDDYEESTKAHMDRNYRCHYNNVLQLCAAVQIWALHTITPAEAWHAQKAHVCHSRTSMNCHLMPNFYLGMHHEEAILCFGPVYAWWGYAIEQNDSFLKKICNNAYTGSQVESILMQGWIKYSLISDLVSRLFLMVTKRASIVSRCCTLLGPQPRYSFRVLWIDISSSWEFSRASK